MVRTKLTALTSLDLALELRSCLYKIESEDAALGLHDFRLNEVKAILNELIGRIRTEPPRDAA